MSTASQLHYEVVTAELIWYAGIRLIASQVCDQTNNKTYFEFGVAMPITVVVTACEPCLFGYDDAGCEKITTIGRC
ncbi:MAG: hypothetical protein WCA79_18330 [Anaerolineales bacterium]